jgi:hypothetical protein
MKILAQLCFIAGLLSIPLSVCMWIWGPELSATSLSQIEDRAAQSSLIAAHKERWGIFVGLWAPTFLILSQVLESRFNECRAMLRSIRRGSAKSDLVIRDLTPATVT